MTIQSWLRNLTHGPRLTRKTHRPRGPHTRKNLYQPSLERLEERALLAYDLGFALGLGSTGSENSQAVATDAAGNVLVTGPFTSASLDLDPGPGEFLLTNAGGYDGFAAKYDPAGNLLWGVRVGGTGDGWAWDVDVDGVGNVLLSGKFAGSVEIGAPGRPPVTLTNGGIYEGFLAKIDQDGNALWATTFGAAADPRFAGGITADGAGNVFATGYEGNRLFVAKYSAGGAAVWTKVVSGGTGKYYPLYNVTSYAQGADLAVDANSNVYVTGEYAGKIDFNPDPNKTNSLSSVGGPQNPSNDAFVLKLNASGAYVWAGSMGGNDMDWGDHVAVDGSVNVLVGGDFYSSTNDFNPGGGILNLVRSGGGIGTFVVKLDPNRNLIWGRSVVGSRDMALDAAGNVYTTGPFSGTIDADPGPGTFNLTAGGTGDVLISKLNSSGNFVWAADILMGGPGSNGISSGIAVDG